MPRPHLTPLSLNDTFRFSCSPTVPCFNQCCRDLNQALTPYDILRLKQHLGLSSGEFLDRFTRRHLGPESGLPMVTLRFEYTRKKKCPFVSPKGCRVYQNRPTSCRTYPLLRALSRSRKTGRMRERYFLLTEPHCRGFEQNESWNAAQWVAAQDISAYNEINDKLMPIISLKNRLMPGPLAPECADEFYTALYNLDEFKSRVLSKGMMGDFHVDSAALDAVFSDDVALLELAMKWIQHRIFDR